MPLILAMLLLACSGASPVSNVTLKHNTEPDEPAVETSEYHVYSALLEEMYPAASGEVVAIEDQTSAGGYIGGGLSSTLLYVSQHVPGGVEQEILRNFEAKNSQPHPLKNLFEIKARYQLVSTAEMHELFLKGSGWEVFFERYPLSKRLITLSAVGLNKAMDRALVYAGSQSGGKSGAGYYLFLDKENDAWVIKHKVEVWTS